ncbi:MAG: hypothetical protein WCT42_01635 [Candidatus Paceibacterota bacterium]|jgi:hypothetical protein
MNTIFIILGLGLIQWLLSLWIKSRIEESIKQEYNKQLEEYKFSISIVARTVLATTCPFYYQNL